MAARQLSYLVIFEPQPQGGYCVTVPALIDCEAAGSTLEEARTHAKEAIEGCLASLVKEGEAVPEDVQAKPVFERTSITVRSKKLSYTALFEPAEEGGYTVTVPALPGCITEGDSLEVARSNLRDAMAGYLEVLFDHGDPIPPDIQTKPAYETLKVALPALTA